MLFVQRILELNRIFRDIFVTQILILHILVLLINNQYKLPLRGSQLFGTTYNLIQYNGLGLECCHSRKFKCFSYNAHNTMLQCIVYTNQLAGTKGLFVVALAAVKQVLLTYNILREIANQLLALEVARCFNYQVLKFII